MWKRSNLSRLFVHGYNCVVRINEHNPLHHYTTVHSLKVEYTIRAIKGFSVRRRVSKLLQITEISILVFVVVFFCVNIDLYVESNTEGRDVHTFQVVSKWH